jgi:hypothetical protein
MSEQRIHCILITGAAGKISAARRAGLRSRYPLID